jgi:uncharacterized membrane protein YphA (DoxX/SURF4 family)
VIPAASPATRPCGFPYPGIVRDRLLRIHSAARRNPVFQRLAVISRLLLAMAFIPTSLVKILGQRFTVMSVETPLGFFFEAMYRSGDYWRFIGWGQMIAGILLLIPRTATVGAVLFFPITLNVFVITVAMEFTGTPVVTGGMLLASVFLLCWDYDKLEAVLFGALRPEDRWGGPGSTMERIGFATGGAAGLVFFGFTRGFVPPQIGRMALLAGFAAAAIVAIAWIRAALRKPSPALQDVADLA